MRTPIKRHFQPAGLGSVVALVLFTSTSRSQDASDLTGAWTWASRDGAAGYSVRQVGQQVWWVGKSDDGGRSWTHVFHGRIKGGQLTGTWADVPLGKAQNQGSLTLDLVSEKGNVVRMSGRLGEEDFTLERGGPKKG